MLKETSHNVSLSIGWLDVQALRSFKETSYNIGVVEGNQKKNIMNYSIFEVVDYLGKVVVVEFEDMWMNEKELVDVVDVNGDDDWMDVDMDELIG